MSRTSLDRSVTLRQRDGQHHYPGYLMLVLLTILVTPFANLNGSW